MAKFKKLKPKFWRFQGQFDLKDQGQGHQFLNSSGTLMRSKTWFKFKDKIQNTSKVIVFTRNHTDHDNADEDDETKNNMSSPGRGGGRSDITNVHFTRVHLAPK